MTLHPRHRPSRTTLLASGLLLVLLAVPVVLTWRAWRQERLNHELIVAIKHNNDSDVLSLLRQGADPNVKDVPAAPRSLWQVGLQKLTGTEAPRAVAGSDALALDIEMNGRSRQREVCLSEPTGIVHALLVHGAHSNAVGVYGYNPILYAADCGYQKVVRELLTRHCDPNAKSAEGNSVLMWATHGGDAAITQLLIEHGANVNAKNDYGESVLKTAKQSNKAVVALLTQAGATE